MQITRRAAAFILSAGLALASLSSFAADNPRVKIATSMGDIVVELYPDKAPKTVDNFLTYVKARHYDGTIFHRVINGFMVQGGNYDEKFRPRPTRPPIHHEGVKVKNTAGTIAMARTSDPNSASDQFFINVSDNAFLDGSDRDPVGYVAFGKVVSGMDVVNKIKGVQTGAAPGGMAQMMPRDVPTTPVVIQSATIVQ
jgi:cyclophilin family peptidyl-prolyl cis-trans isomerase